jgi:hypothetical protein
MNAMNGYKRERNGKEQMNETLQGCKIQGDIMYEQGERKEIMDK